MAKFIILTSNETDTLNAMNVDHIVSVMPNNRGGATVKLSTMQHFYVKESFADIIKILGGK